MLDHGCWHCMSRPGWPRALSACLVLARDDMSGLVYSTHCLLCYLVCSAYMPAFEASQRQHAPPACCAQLLHAIRELWMVSGLLGSRCKDVVAGILFQEGVDTRCTIRAHLRALTSTKMDFDCSRRSQLYIAMQVPRLYDIYKHQGIIENFEQLLENIFMPLFEVTVNPESHPQLHQFLATVGPFVSAVSHVLQVHAWPQHPFHLLVAV